MSEIVIVTCGSVSQEVIDETTRAARDVPFDSVLVCPESIDPGFALEPQRRQYNSPLLLKRLLTAKPRRADRVLGITEHDLYIPMLTFVFGQAQVGGEGALVSAARLRQEFYKLPPDPLLLSERLRKEVLHELGHTLSLIHCPDARCVMSLATGVRQVDEKSTAYCDSCRAMIRLTMRQPQRAATARERNQLENNNQ